MKRLLFLGLVVCLAALGQNPSTAVFPTAVATDTTIFVAVNSSHSTLSSGINDSTLTIPVVDGAQFLGGNIVTIGSERLLVCSVDGNTLTICTGGRGFDGTTALAQNSGVAVDGYIYARNFNQIAAEIKAIQTALGAAILNVGGGHVAWNAGGDYLSLNKRIYSAYNAPENYSNFTAQPTVNLTGAPLPVSGFRAAPVAGATNVAGINGYTCMMDAVDGSGNASVAGEHTCFGGFHEATATSVAAGTNFFGGDFHVAKPSGAAAASGLIGAAIGMHKVPALGTEPNIGLHLWSHDVSPWTNTTRAGSAITVEGTAGWTWAFKFFKTGLGNATATTPDFGVDQYGKINGYAGEGTYGNGVPAIRAVVNLSAQTGSIAWTSLIPTDVPLGMYRACHYLYTTYSGSGGTVALDIAWNDEIEMRTKSISAISLTSHTYAEGCTIATVKAGASPMLLFQTTVAGAAGSPTYSLNLTAERLY